MKRLIITIVLFCIGFCFAQPRALHHQDDIVSILKSAQYEILLVTPKHQILAYNEAIRQAIVERGVEVFLLTAEETVFDNNSFSPLLSLIANVNIQASGNFVESFLIVDRHFIVTGDLLARELNVLDQGATQALADKHIAENYVRAFLEAWHEARPFEINESNIDILFSIGGLDVP